MEYLHKSVRRTVAALSRLRIEIDDVEAPIRRSVRLNLDIQSQGLVMLERELRTRHPSRRVWSLGQASIPMLSILLKSIERQANGLELPSIPECRDSVDELGDALTRYAEDR